MFVCAFTSGGHPAEGGPHALGWRICHRVWHHRPGKLWGGGTAPKSPGGDKEAEKRAPGARGEQVRFGPRPAGRHGGRRAPGGRDGVRLLRVFGVRQWGWLCGRGFPRAVPGGEAPQGRAGQGQAPQLHHTCQTGHQQDADQDQQLGEMVWWCGKCKKNDSCKCFNQFWALEGTKKKTDLMCFPL